ncbi:MAG: hypothetical protein ACRD38_07170, partial [Nitrososphaerales archaeon]
AKAKRDVTSSATIVIPIAFRVLNSGFNDKWLLSSKYVALRKYFACARSHFVYITSNKKM